MRSTHATSIIERVSGLAFFAVSRQVKLWYQMCDSKFRQVDVPMRGLETIVEVDGPLAGDIVRDLDITNFATLKI